MVKGSVRTVYVMSNAPQLVAQKYVRQTAEMFSRNRAVNISRSANHDVIRRS